MIFEEAYNEFKKLEVDRDAKYNTEYTTEQIEEYKTHLSSTISFIEYTILFSFSHDL